MSTHFETQRHIVRNLIAPGLTILAGSPKVGKSFFSLDLVQCVAKGEPFLSRDVTPGDVLYLALEDSAARLQRRSRELGHTESTSRLSFLLDAPTIQEGLLSTLEEWVKEVSEPRLIVIDTLQRVRGINTSRDVYGADYQALHTLKSFADKYKLAIVAIHHLAKPTLAQRGGDVFDRVNGSNGVTGAVDAMIVMDGKRGEGTATLKIAARDVESEDIPLIRSGAKWICTSPEAVAREKYERDPLVPIIRALKKSQFTEHAWSTTFENFASAVNTIKGAPIMNAQAAGKWLRAREGDLLRFDGIAIKNDVRLGTKRGVRFNA